MSRKPMLDGDFSRLITELQSETDDTERKLARLYYSHGDFSGSQAASIVGTFKTAPERVRVLRILEHRLCPMNCEEGESVLRNVQLTQRDKLDGLEYIKRAFYDHQTIRGSEHIMRAFIHEQDKRRALKQLCAISSYTSEAIPAGISSPKIRDAHTKYANGKADLQTACHPSYTYGLQLDRSYYINGGCPPLPPRPIDTAVTGPAYKPSLHIPLSRSSFDPESRKPCHSSENLCLGSEQSGATSIGFIDHQKMTYSKCC